jgi:hypothetical protein
MIVFHVQFENKHSVKVVSPVNMMPPKRRGLAAASTASSVVARSRPGRSGWIQTLRNWHTRDARKRSCLKAYAETQ